MIQILTRPGSVAGGCLTLIFLSTPCAKGFGKAPFGIAERLCEGWPQEGDLSIGRAPSLEASLCVAV